MTVPRRLCVACVLLFLAGCGKSTADWIKQARSADPGTRLHAVQALQARTTDRDRVVPVLTEALNDDDSSVRRDAARGLAHFGPDARDAVPILVARLRDREPSVRRAAGQALKQIDPAAASRAGVR